MTVPQNTRSPRGTAVVIGGSIAGCTTAASLVELYERVVIIDRDELPATRKERKGVPHAYQFHALTALGRQALEEALPGLTQTALDGGVPGHDPGETRYSSKSGFFQLVKTGLLVLLSSRINLEYLVREQARTVPALEMIERTKVTGLQIDQGAVTGVHVLDGDAQARTIAADLVVDASGRTSATPQWLEAAGYPRPIEQVVNAKWGYVTSYVRPDPEFSPPYNVLYITPTLKGEGPRATRGAGMWKQEDGLWVLTAQGCAGDLPPADEAGFRDFLGSFGRTEFVDLLDRSHLERPRVAWRNTTNVLRDYAGISSRPERFVVLGDAAAAFNPYYGQGMSSAALGARLLRDLLREWFTSIGEDLTGFGERFQKQLDGLVIQNCWGISAGSDLGVPGVEINGVPQSVEKSDEQQFVDRVLALATEEPEVARKVVEMIQMIRGPEWMAEEDLRANVIANWERLGELSRDDQAAVL
ncbi:NAD(P)/FAD-dependent oxidoreductase [Mycolicibacterium sp. P9-22]|uniref:FAD-dependent oxidoreductase n=1 Tax=Mycolicibacterium sp. P9-22 TaxID=2024613 RepID=UPI0011ED8F7B|nr:FAD-dependent monooxygenase [Mycolicibacterium sp. P9-22]KAA0120635.1 FAD-dependent monooxygenase [Mycolicibacterium sp. P9-22]